MRNSRRIAGLGLSVLVVGALVGGVASAQSTTTVSAETYSAEASARALNINLFGQQLTGSTVTAGLTSLPQAEADAGAVILPQVGLAVGAVDAAVATNDSSVTNRADAGDCLLKSEAEALPGIGRLDITCPVAEAAITNGLPSAKAFGSEVRLDVSASEVLETVGLQDTLNDVVDTTFETAIDPIVGALTGTPIEGLVEDTSITLEQLLKDVLNLDTTVRVVVAPALAEVTTTEGEVIASARAQGLRIEVLPLDNSVTGSTEGVLPDDLLPGEPLLTITVGDAVARSVKARGTDAPAVPEATAALVTIKVGTVALLDGLGLLQEEIRVEGGQSLCILETTPLETCIAVAAASTDAAAGTATAQSATIHALKGVQGGALFELGSAGVGALGAPEVLGTTITPPNPVLPVELPRTGGTPVLPLAGAGLAAMALGVRRLASRKG